MATKKITSKGVPPLKVGILASDETRDAAIKRYVEEQYRRMESLADSLDIPDDLHRWYALALHLAMHHVPELKDAKPMGAPKKWGDYELGVLAVEIERELDRQGGGTVGRAAASLAERKPWKTFLQVKGGTYLGPDPTAALVKAYSAAKKSRWTRVCRDAFLYHKKFDTVHEWDAEVLAIEPPGKK